MRVMPAACHAILSPLDNHALLICMLYNFCYVMSTLCALYCDVVLYRDLISEWKWPRFCIAGNHIAKFLSNVVFASLCGYFVVCMCACVCECVHGHVCLYKLCVCLCVCTCTFVFISVYVCV